MLNALKKKGSSLFGLDAYKVVKEQEVRFRQFGFAKVYAIDVLSSFELLDQDEKDRIEKLEEWDEFEEFDIECVHYSFVMGFSNTKMTELLPKTDYPYHEYLEIPSSPTVVATVLNEHQQTLLNIWGHTVSNVDNVLYLIGGYGGEKMIRQKQSWFKPSLVSRSMRCNLTCRRLIGNFLSPNRANVAHKTGCFIVLRHTTNVYTCTAAERIQRRH